MKDAIVIRGVRVRAHHGVMAHEAEVGQQFVLDIDLCLDLSAAAQSDRLSDTVSYADVVDLAQSVFCARRYRLIEAAGDAVCQALFDRFNALDEVVVTVHKPHAPIAAIFDDVAVTVSRSRGRGP